MSYRRIQIFKNPLFEKTDVKKCSLKNGNYWLEETDSFNSFRDLYKLRQVKHFLGVDNLTHTTDIGIELVEKTIFIKKTKRPTGEPCPDSVKRAKDRIFDYTFNNKFYYFFTGTINQKRFNSKSPDLLLKPVQEWSNCL
ncbi:MAG: hypothetical protein K2J39_04325 [Ruminococcus sp.]|nr:hypothetical protein [Ruminococcus sp.]